MNLNPDAPLLDLLWTGLLVLGWGLAFYLLFFVFRDLFGRADVSAWAKAGWVVLVLVLPIIGSLVYLASQSRSLAERELERNSAAVLRQSSYARSVTGDGQFHGLHDKAAESRAMSGPLRPA